MFLAHGELLSGDHSRTPAGIRHSWAIAQGASTVRVHRYADGHQLIGSVSVGSDVVNAECADWGILLSENLDLVTRCVNMGPKLGTICDVKSAFTVSEAYQLSDYIRDSSSPTSKDFRFLNTGSIDPYVALWGKVDTTYLKKKYRWPVVSRTAFRTGFPRRFLQMASPKIIITGIRHFEAFFDENGDWIAGKSTVVLQGFRNDCCPFVLLAVLNSAITTFFLKECYGSLGMDGGINFTPTNVREIPVPTFSRADSERLRNLVRDIISTKTKTTEADISRQRHTIDQIIFSTLSLSPNESARIVDRIQGSRRRRAR
ncbi:MAG: hypothetical protein HZA46_17630 [Planctomycetales bacterium]|nr:hypothetical protein [Planctomycetales bacterium]